MSETRICRGCEKAKPATEFYPINKDEPNGRRKNICRDCDNTRERKRTLARVLRHRARHRASAELIRLHRDEFENLLNYFTDVAGAEAEMIDERSRAAHAPGGIPKLSPGQRREGQIAEDRIVQMWAEVGKCRDCTTHHQHGHACTHCGHPVDGQPPPPLPDNRGTCTCPHPLRRHDPDVGCLLDCTCSGYPADGEVFASRPVAGSGTGERG